MEEKSIEIQEDRSFNNREHRVKLAGKIMLVLILIAVLAGFTGKGPASKYVTGDAQAGVTVTAQKYVRYESPVEMEMLVNTAALAADSMLDISFPGSYIKHFKIESIQPEPQHAMISGDRVVFRFVIEEPGESQRIIFYMRPQSLLNSVEATVQIEEKVEAHLEHFIYP